MKLLLLFILLFFVSLPITAQNEEDITGRKAPNFKLVNLDGKYVELDKETGGGPVLLSFWATWCKPCLEEMVEYNKIYEQYEDKGFTSPRNFDRYRKICCKSKTIHKIKRI